MSKKTKVENTAQPAQPAHPAMNMFNANMFSGNMIENPPVTAIESNMSMVFALLSQAGNVGKSTFAHLLCNPAINVAEHGYQRPVWINADTMNNNTMKTELIDLSKRLDTDFVPTLNEVILENEGIRDVAIDAGNSNTSSVITILSNPLIESNIHRYVLPLVIGDQEVVKDAIDTLALLKDAGIDMKKVRVVPNKVPLLADGKSADLTPYRPYLDRFQAAGIPVNRNIFVPYEEFGIGELRYRYGLTPLEAVLLDVEKMQDYKGTIAYASKGFAFNRYMETRTSEASHYYNCVMAAKTLLFFRLNEVKEYIRGV
jgi:hypothetical protein